MATKLLIFLTLFFLTFYLGSATTVRPKLLLFLLDGLRHDYINDEALESLPGFKEIVSRGVKVDYMTPDFPSISYPNYYSLMTGCHCDIHHMTGNYMWDSNTNKSFDIGVNKDSLLPLWWNGSEPLWVTMTKARRDVSMYYWPGCEVEILGVRPSYCEQYKTVPTDAEFANAVSNAPDSFTNGKTDLAAIYYEHIDQQGHYHGPLFTQTKNAIRAVDTILQQMFKGIQERGLDNTVNIMLFSDHGMTDVHPEMDKVIELKEYINLSDVLQMKDQGPVVSLWPVPGKHSEVANKLKLVEHMAVYEKEEIPTRFHYQKGKFVSPLTLVADEGWLITQKKEALPKWMKEIKSRKFGMHGYDDEFTDMRGIFLAYGPDFKSNFRAAPIRAVDVYNVMCNVLGITPLPNNGSWSLVECMLKSQQNVAHSIQLSSYALAFILLLLFVTV